MSDKKLKITSTKLTSIDEDNYIVKAIISDDSEDRHGEVVVQEGWDFSEYQSNAVVLFGHESWELPIGKTLDIEIDGNKTIATMQLAVKENPDKVLPIWNLIKGGYLKTVSVGFINMLRDGAKLLENRLLEISFVPVPANPNAITLAYETGVIERKDALWLKDAMRRELKQLDKISQKEDTMAEDKTKDSDKLDTLTDAVSSLTEQVTKLAEQVQVIADGNTAKVGDGDVTGSQADTDQANSGKEESSTESDAKDEPNEDSSGADDADVDEDNLTPEQAAEVEQAVATALTD